MSFLTFLKTVATKEPTLPNGDRVAPQFFDENQKGTKTLVYPYDLFPTLVDAPPYILFKRKDSVATNTGFLSYTYLYMPPGVGANYSAEYQEGNSILKYYQSLGRDASAFLNGTANTVGGMPSNMKEALNKMSPGLSGKAGLAMDVMITAAPQTSLGQDLSRLRGKTLNPHQAMYFKGVSFRTFTFDFQFVARNAKESQTIIDIIKEFKLGMHPAEGTNGDSRFWIYPDTYEIELYGPNGKEAGDAGMFKINTCALNGMTVSYNGGSNIPSFHKDGKPLDIKVALEFKELGVLSKQLIEKGY